MRIWGRRQRFQVTVLRTGLIVVPVRMHPQSVAGMLLSWVPFKCEAATLDEQPDGSFNLGMRSPAPAPPPSALDTPQVRQTLLASLDLVDAVERADSYIPDEISAKAAKVRELAQVLR